MSYAPMVPLGRRGSDGDPTRPSRRVKPAGWVPRPSRAEVGRAAPNLRSGTRGRPADWRGGSATLEVTRFQHRGADHHHHGDEQRGGQDRRVRRRSGTAAPASPSRRSHGSASPRLRRRCLGRGAAVDFQIALAFQVEDLSPLREPVEDGVRQVPGRSPRLLPRHPAEAAFQLPIRYPVSPASTAWQPFPGGRNHSAATPINRRSVARWPSRSATGCRAPRTHSGFMCHRFPTTAFTARKTGAALSARDAPSRRRGWCAAFEPRHYSRCRTA